MTEITIAKARTIHIEEIDIPAKGDLPARTVIASKLLISSLKPSNDPRMIGQGHMVVPIHLPFGKSFVVVLREDDGTIPAPQGRQFKEDE